MLEATVPHKKPLNIRIKEARERAKLSQSELAIELDVSIGTVRSWEYGISEPKRETHIKMASVLDVPLSRFNRF